MLVVSERRATGTIFNAFGMARPGFEPTTSLSQSGRSTICAIGPGVFIDDFIWVWSQIATVKQCRASLNYHISVMYMIFVHLLILK